MTRIKKNKVIVIAVIVIAVILVSIAVLITFNKPTYPLEYEYSIGRDSRGYVGNGRFQLWHTNGIDILTCESARKSESVGETNSRSGIVLEYEYDHSFDSYGNLYYFSADGYAVVYAKDNLCKVFITEPPVDLVTGDFPEITFRFPENNYRVRRLEGEGYEEIVYLDSFEEFTEKEQKELKKLEKTILRSFLR